MSTETNICNMALAHLGDQRIGALSDNTEAARACNAMYEMSRDALLRKHPWNFAIARATLAAEVTGPNWGPTKSFVLPTDPFCLRVLEVDGHKDHEWSVEGRKIVGDMDSAKIRYISKTTDPAEFDAVFVVALASYIATKIAVRLTGSNQIKRDVLAIHAGDMKEARSTDGQEGAVPETTADSFLDERD
jgi:hypothetical protein